MNAQTKIARPTVVNGINVDDLFALIDSVKRDAAKGKNKLARDHDLAGPSAESCAS
jgi:hypothetical protein